MYSGIFYAEDYNNDLANTLNAATNYGSAVVHLQPGYTYVLDTKLNYTDKNNLTVYGNNATIHCVNVDDYGIKTTSCKNWFWYNTFFTSTDDTDAAYWMFLADEGCDNFLFNACDFSYFNATPLRGLPFAENGLLRFTDCNIHHIKTANMDGVGTASPAGIGIDPSSWRRVIIKGVEFYQVGQSNKDHTVYMSRGTDLGSDVIISNCLEWDCKGTAFTVVATAGGFINSCIVDACVARNMGGEALIFNAKSASINDYKVYGGTGLRLSGNDRVKVNDCTFIGNPDTQYLNGILIWPGTNGLVEIRNTDLHDYAVAISVMADVDQLIIENNTGINVYSLATVFSGYTVDYISFQQNHIKHTNFGFNVDAGGTVVIRNNIQLPGSSGPLLDVDNVDILIQENNVFTTGGAAGALDNITAMKSDALLKAVSSGFLYSVATLQKGVPNPSVKQGTRFILNNDTPTVLTGFTDAVAGSSWVVECRDNNTILRFDGENLRGENSKDYKTTVGDLLYCYYDGSKTYIQVTKVKKN